MVNQAIAQLVRYGVTTKMLEQEDVVFATNALLEAMKLADYDAPETVADSSLEEILKVLLDDACSRGVIDDNITSRDLFDTLLMSKLMARPSEVIKKFQSLYAESPEKATDWYYDLSQNSDYIRRYRIAKDKKWVTPTQYGDLDITINLSKPEKDPKAIAAAKNAPQSGYPKCLLCKENEGYAGRMNHPARQNHRIIPVTIDGLDWFMQYSPYVYYNEHCIVFNGSHSPMAINRSSFRKLLDFVKAFPHYFVGSNADLPIVGGSILTHDHFQGGHYTFAMEKALVEIPVSFPGFDDVTCGIVKWPMSVLRLSGDDDNRLVDLADVILKAWRGYTDETATIFAETDGTPHNTITPIARMRNGKFELDLVLRNNKTSEEHPMGIYHPHGELHHIKKENIGLIEVMGLAVLPARLKAELEHLAEVLVAGGDVRSYEDLEKHGDWTDELAKTYTFTQENVMEILEKEVGLVFATVLEHAGVYPTTEKGRADFLKFVASVK